MDIWNGNGELRSVMQTSDIDPTHVYDVRQSVDGVALSLPIWPDYVDAQNECFCATTACSLPNWLS
ncbi:MAG: hypothetical protein AAF826_12395 [Pseudomonadota bacterium]